MSPDSLVSKLYHIPRPDFSVLSLDTARLPLLPSLMCSLVLSLSFSASFKILKTHSGCSFSFFLKLWSWS